MTHYLAMGLILGLSAGLAPGPLLTLVVSETLSHGLGAGLRVALAPLITDLPIVLAALFLMGSLKDYHLVLGLISMAGSLVILNMGVGNLRTTGALADSTGSIPRSLSRGIMVNLLSPHPYLFWISVGGPFFAKAWDTAPANALAFVLVFYLLLIGSKAGLAWLTARSRSFLSGRAYVWTMKALGLMLCVLAVILALEGLELMGVPTFFGRPRG